MPSSTPRSPRFAAALARGRHRARAAARAADARHGRFPDRVLGRAPRRRRAGADQHAADAGADRLHPGRQPRRGAGRLRAAAAGAAPVLRGCRPAPDRRRRRRTATPARRPSARRRWANSSPGDRRAAGRRASPDEVAFWLYSSGSTGAPKGVRHVHASLRATADTYGAQVLGIDRRRRDVLGREAVLRLRARQRDDLPDVGRRRRRAAAGPADAGCGARHACARYQPDHLRRRADALCGAAGRPGARPRRRLGPAAPLHLRRRGAARSMSARAGASAVGVDILDGIGSTEMLHIFLSNRPGDVRYGTTGKPVPGYEAAHRRRATARTCRTAKPASCWCAAPVPPTATGTSATKSRRTFRGEWTHTGDTYARDADGYYRYLRPHRRHAEGRRHLGLAVRGRGSADRASRRCWRPRWSASRTPTG